MREQREHHGRDWVALTLAVGLVAAFNCITFAVLYDAIFSSTSGLSENATQILTAAFGGITGILGGYIGFRAGENERERNQQRVDHAGQADVDTNREATDPSDWPQSPS